MGPDHITNIVRKGEGKTPIISILEEIQDKYAYLPEEALRLVAQETGHSLVDIYGVATFYRAFSLKPRGKHCVSVCLGTACHVRGAQRIVDEFMRELAIRPGETTSDNEITLETVNCLGACALGPTVVVDGHYFPHVNKEEVQEIITKARDGLGKIDMETDSRVFPLQVSCPRCGKSLMDPDYPIDGRPSIRFDVFEAGKKGWMRLSSLYGSDAAAREHEAPADGGISSFYCPHCLEELPGFSNCLECGSSMAALFVREGCSWEICTRPGCRGHMLNLDQKNL